VRGGRTVLCPGFGPWDRAGPGWAQGCLGLLSLALSLGACASASLPPPAARLAEPEPAAEEIERASRIERPRQVVFRWRLRDGGRRVEGRGVARLAPGYRARLDLFTENGETAAIAALSGVELRLPSGADRRLIPPPPLLWASLGVLQPGSEASLVEGFREGNGKLLLRYDLAGEEELRYTVRETRIRRVELLREGRVVERVNLTGEEPGSPLPREAEYRNLTAFRELSVSVESIEDVEPFPEEIWRPGS